ncbi:MAG TPA: DUF2071 domain-containing protein [Candidatus Methylomirabilis sp.]|nr:DUF2071 domain-containing protein [Candidatus Methylomirabilis sp.]
MHVSLKQLAHRPWDLPAGPWVMAQNWHDLLFAHWPVPKDLLRVRIPDRLEVDIFEGRAWVGIVPFRMSGVRLRGTPALPGLSAFLELNVRTYVLADGKPGVWFFSLDAGSPIAVAIARAWFHLPYFHAGMTCVERDGWIEYRSERTHRRAVSAELVGRYRPTGEVFRAKSGSLEHFVTERYCLYAVDRRGRVLRGEIHHAPWALQVAEAKFTRNTMMEVAGFALPDAKPLLHFSRRQDVLVWRPEHIAP